MRQDQLQFLGVNEGSKGRDFVPSRGRTEPAHRAKMYFSVVAGQGGGEDEVGTTHCGKKTIKQFI